MFNVPRFSLAERIRKYTDWLFLFPGIRRTRGKKASACSETEWFSYSFYFISFVESSVMFDIIQQSMNEVKIVLITVRTWWKQIIRNLSGRLKLRYTWPEPSDIAAVWHDIFAGVACIGSAILFVTVFCENEFFLLGIYFCYAHGMLSN